MREKIKKILNYISYYGFGFIMKRLYRHTGIYKKEKEKYMKELVLGETVFTERPFLDIKSPIKKTAYFDVLFIKENELNKNDKASYKKYMDALKAKYVKELIPEIYNKYKDNPVENKVVFLENGKPHSPSNYLLSKTIKAQKKYKVYNIGLRIRSISYIEHYEESLKAMKNIATAKAVFISSANYFFSYIDLRKETKLIQRWHGLGAFKKFGFSTAENKHFGLSFKAREEYDQYRNYSYVTLPSEEQIWIFEDAMRISRESGILLPIGAARTDSFFDPNYFKESYKKLYNAFPQMKGKKIILYAPTFRGAVSGAKAPDKIDIKKFYEALKDDYVLIIKHHQVIKELPEIPKEYKNSFVFDLSRSNIAGIDRLLAAADILITDYSSVGFEYSLLERPIIFFAYDLEEYIDKRGMYYDYEELTPGPVCKTNEEMIEYILHIDEKFDKQKIIDFKNKHVGNCDGHSVERTIGLIERTEYDTRKQEQEA